jgi:hypothetical protein
MTEDEIKEATRAALAAKPVVISVKKKEVNIWRHTTKNPPLITLTQLKKYNDL